MYELVRACQMSLFERGRLLRYWLRLVTALRYQLSDGRFRKALAMVVTLMPRRTTW